MVKEDIEKFYCDSCNIYEYEEYTEGNVTKHREVLKYSNLKCRISYSTGYLFNRLSSGQKTIDGFKLNQSIKLFLPNNIEVKAGSKIEITHQNQTITFINSLISSVYKHHTEILLDNSKEWA